MSADHKHDPRYSEFEKLMDVLAEISKVAGPYQNQPRTYGTEDALFLAEVHTLRMIGRHKGISITEIAERTRRTKGAVSQVVDKLVEKGLLAKERSPEDQRRLLLSLTDSGRKVFDFHENYDKTHYCEILRNLQEFSSEDLAAARVLISKLIEVVNR